MQPRAIAERAARELETQRRKHEQFASMMDEISSSGSDSDSDDAPVRRRPVRRATRPPDSVVAEALSPGRASSHGGSFRAGAGKEADSEDEAIASFGIATSAALPFETKEVPTNSLGSPTDFEALRASLLAPTQPGVTVRTTVLRNKSGRNLLSPLWSVILEDRDKFLMCAKKRMAKKTSNYLISMDPAGVDRKSPLVVGKVRANWSGSGYHLYDEGMNPEKAKSEESLRRDLVFVAFDYDAMGPGKMEIGVPRVSPGGVATVCKPRGEEDTVEAQYKRRDESLMYLANKRPKWDDTVKGHVLNFHGRVTQSSVKNFQLACTELGDETILQFGRVGDNRFTMDYRYPLSPLQAFGIVIASLDGKLADSKSFQAVKKTLGKDGGGLFSRKKDSSKK